MVPLLGQDALPSDWRDTIFSQIGKIQMIHTKRKLNVYDSEPGEFYNLLNEPNEFKNLIQNPQYTDTIEKLLNGFDS